MTRIVRKLNSEDKTLCVICEKPYQYRNVFWKSKEYPELMCCEFKVSHTDCQRVYDKVDRLEKELMNAKFDLYLLNDKYY